MNQPKTPFEIYGKECGEGWTLLIFDLVKDLQKMGWDGDIYQIKEKFGGLRFYIGEGTEEMFKRINKASKDSYHICELCGQPGELRKGRWLKTLCDEHSDGRKAYDSKE